MPPRVLSLRGLWILSLILAVAACARSTPAPVENKGVIGFHPRDQRSSGTVPVPGRIADIIVRKGDTVWGIARRTGVPVRTIISANDLKAPFRLLPGKGLRVPSTKRHTVQRGDTIYRISRRYGVDMASLVRLNGLKAPYTIRLSQQLRLPATARLTAPPRNVEETSSVGARRTVRGVGKPLPPRGGSLFAWPVEGRILDGYGAKGGGRYNDGVNIAAARGQPVRAADNGIVAYAGSELRGLGNLLLIRHAGGWITAYAHNEALLVERGDVVRRGQVVSRVGQTGNVRSPQLHFEIRKGTRTVDPTRYLPRLTSLPVQPDPQSAGQILHELPGDAA